MVSKIPFWDLLAVSRSNGLLETETKLFTLFVPRWVPAARLLKLSLELKANNLSSFDKSTCTLTDESASKSLISSLDRVGEMQSLELSRKVSISLGVIENYE